MNYDDMFHDDITDIAGYCYIPSGKLTVCDLENHLWLNRSINQQTKFGPWLQ